MYIHAISASFLIQRIQNFHAATPLSQRPARMRCAVALLTAVVHAGWQAAEIQHGPKAGFGKFQAVPSPFLSGTGGSLWLCQHGVLSLWFIRFIDDTVYLL